MCYIELHQHEQHRDQRVLGFSATVLLTAADYVTCYLAVAKSLPRARAVNRCGVLIPHNHHAFYVTQHRWDANDPSKLLTCFDDNDEATTIVWWVLVRFMWDFLGVIGNVSSNSD